MKLRVAKELCIARGRCKRARSVCLFACLLTGVFALAIACGHGWEWNGTKAHGEIKKGVGEDVNAGAKEKKRKEERKFFFLKKKVWQEVCRGSVAMQKDR